MIKGEKKGQDDMDILRMSNIFYSSQMESIRVQTYDRATTNETKRDYL